jgi:cyclic pyranopterin phosphate synthase
MTDNHGRVMRKLRVSLLDACNFRCTYCMPASATFSKMHDLLTPDEIGTIVSNLNKLGLEEVRLTGGEPTLRTELIEIVERLSELPLKSLGMTTNGFLLKQFIPDLKKTNLKSLNISLDSLNPDNFKALARFDGRDEVVAAIDAAIEAGFKVKLNTVLMRQNLGELEDLMEFAKIRKIEIRFLELMKIGVALETFKETFVPAADVIHKLRKQYLMKQIDVAKDSTAFKYQLDQDLIVGFIASESMPFCGSCSRLRLDSKGSLRSCLMQENKLNLRGLSFDKYPDVVSKVINLKPYDRIEKIEQPMYQIGG